MQEFIVTISTFFEGKKKYYWWLGCNTKENDPVTVATWYIQDLNAFRDLKCFSCSNSERWQSLFLKKTLAASLSFVSRMCSHYAKKLILREPNFFGKTQCLVASSLFMYKSLVPHRISVQKMNAIMPKRWIIVLKCRRTKIILLFTLKRRKNIFVNIEGIVFSFYHNFV